MLNKRCDKQYAAACGLIFFFLSEMVFKDLITKNHLLCFLFFKQMDNNCYFPLRELLRRNPLVKTEISSLT